jgi:trehalose 6-phosphate synthase/phosphatase
MELYVDRLPGAFIEEKELTLAWHYRQADVDLGPLRAKELAAHLMSLTETSDLKVVEGNKVIEVRPSEFSKGVACQGFLARGYDFILAVGDDTTDEDLFRVLPETAWSIRVGLRQSRARFNVYNQAQIRELLDALAGASLERHRTRLRTDRSVATTSEPPFAEGIRPAGAGEVGGAVRSTGDGTPTT